MSSRHRTAVIAALVALGLAACGGDATTTTTTTTPASDTTSTTTTTTAPSTTTSEPTTTTEATTTTTTTTTLPGESLDFGPDEGDLLAVVGVSHDDVLNVRAAPGTDQEIIDTLAATADGVPATGRARSLPASIWYEVDTGEVTGWVGSSFIGQLGATTDATSQVMEALGSDTRAESLEELGRRVAETYVIFDEPEARVTMTVAPTVGDLGEVTFDVLDFPDDAVAGVRVHVFAQPLDGGGFELRTVEATSICRRGVTEDGLCV